jgi:hypothetical protein
MSTYQRPNKPNNQSVLSFTHDGVTFEGFRPYQGESDRVNIGKLHGPARYALVIAICSEDANNHHIWVVIDSKHFTDAFTRFTIEHLPKVKFTRYLRSRT